jgi:hypothetical protein
MMISSLVGTLGRRLTPRAGFSKKKMSSTDFTKRARQSGPFGDDMMFKLNI